MTEADKAKQGMAPSHGRGGRGPAARPRRAARAWPGGGLPHGPPTAYWAVAVHGEPVRQHEEATPRDLATLPLSELTAADCDELYGQLAGRGLKPSTIRTTHAALRGLTQPGHQVGLESENPTRNATPPANRPPTRARIEPADVWAMIERAQRPKENGGEGDVILAVAIFLATYPGARRGELCGLRWDGFDGDAGTLTISQQWVPQTASDSVWLLSSPRRALSTDAARSRWEPRPWLF